MRRIPVFCARAAALRDPVAADDYRLPQGGLIGQLRIICNKSPAAGQVDAGLVDPGDAA